MVVSKLHNSRYKLFSESAPAAIYRTLYHLSHFYSQCQGSIWNLKSPKYKLLKHWHDAASGKFHAGVMWQVSVKTRAHLKSYIVAFRLRTKCVWSIHASEGEARLSAWVLSLTICMQIFARWKIWNPKCVWSQEFQTRDIQPELYFIL